MKKSTNKKFSEFYKELTVQERVNVRDAFLDKSGLRYPSWYSKIKEGQFSKLELDALSEICGVEFEA